MKYQLYKCATQRKQNSHSEVWLIKVFFFLVRATYYSVLKLFTGFAIAAFIAWKLTVIKAIETATDPAMKKVTQLMLIR